MPEQVTKKKEAVKDLLPEELTFICRMCHLAANKQMKEKVVCGDKNITGEYCKLVNNLRHTLVTQAKEIEVSRKYLNMFKQFMGARAVFRKCELKEIYEKYATKSPTSFEELMNFCEMNDIEILE